MNKTHYQYSPKEMSDLLGVGDSTLRKYCIAIENHNYFFSRTDNQRRVFFDKDVVVLKAFRDLVKVQNMSMENASAIVASKYKDETSEQTDSANNVPDIRSEENHIVKLVERMEQMENTQNQLIELNTQLLKRLDEQQKYIEERLEKRDNLLMESIRESQETKQLLLEHQKEEKKKRKGIFGFFK
jgi:DNA-binding transcriptional MerR regulator